jgi:hypothetical protein
VIQSFSKDKIFIKRKKWWRVRDTHQQMSIIDVRLSKTTFRCGVGNMLTSFTLWCGA